MILETPNCPICGQPASHIAETQLAYAEISFSGDEGEADYTGFCMDPCSHELHLDEEGQACVLCRNGHRWATQIDNEW